MVSQRIPLQMELQIILVLRIFLNLDMFKFRIELHQEI